MCHICGADLTKSDNVEIGLFLLKPRGEVYYKNELLPFTMQQAQFLFTIASYKGRPVNRILLSERISDSENFKSLIQVVYYNVKVKFKQLNIDFPLYNVHGIGICWKV